MGRVAMLKTVNLGVLLILLGILVACSSISVQRDWDPGVDFSQFETFYLLENEEPAVNALVDQRIVNAIVSELTKKGLRQADTVEQADLAVGYQVATETRTSYQTIHSNWGSRGYRGSRAHWGGAVGTSRTTQFQFDIGSLVIAVFKMDSKDLIWEGEGSGTVNPSSGPEQSTQHINNVVQQILRDFPPK